MARVIHICQSVTGPLRNWTKREWKAATKWMLKPDGSQFTPDGLKDAFLRELAQGHEVIPIGECDNFDYKTGCRGHHIPDEEHGGWRGLLCSPSFKLDCVSEAGDGG
jgi:hypothetical protein